MRELIKMINDMNFDTAITRVGNGKEIDFAFHIEHAISPTDMTLSISNNEDKGREEKYKIVSYLYGRLTIEGKSFFAEVVGYIDKAQPRIVTYHIAYIDPKFFDEFNIDYSFSEFSESDNVEFL